MPRGELAELRRDKIGIVFQQPNLLPSLTSTEQLQVMAQIDGSPPALDRERGAAVVELITRLTHRQATATVLVTHDRTHLTAVDRIAEVRDGRLHLSART